MCVMTYVMHMREGGMVFWSNGERGYGSFTTIRYTLSRVLLICHMLGVLHWL